MNGDIGKLAMKPSDPGEFIRAEILEEFGLSVTEAAKALGVRRATLSDLVHGHAALSPEMALRVEKAFGVSMETLLACRHGSTPAPCGSGQGEIDVPRFKASASNHG